MFILWKTRAERCPVVLVLSGYKSVSKLLCYHVIWCNIIINEEKVFHTKKLQQAIRLLNAVIHDTPEKSKQGYSKSTTYQ